LVRIILLIPKFSFGKFFLISLGGGNLLNHNLDGQPIDSYFDIGGFIAEAI